MHIRQPKIAAVVAIGEFFVIEAELMQNGGMEVVHVHLALHGVVTVFVGIAVRKTWFEAASGKANGKTIRVMIAAGALILCVWSPPKFAAPPYNGIIQ